MLWKFLGVVPGIDAETPFEVTGGRLYTMAEHGPERMPPSGRAPTRRGNGACHVRARTKLDALEAYIGIHR